MLELKELANQLLFTWMMPWETWQILKMSWWVSVFWVRWPITAWQSLKRWSCFKSLHMKYCEGLTEDCRKVLAEGKSQVEIIKVEFCTGISPTIMLMPIIKYCLPIEEFKLTSVSPIKESCRLNGLVQNSPNPLRKLTLVNCQHQVPWEHSESLLRSHCTRLQFICFNNVEIDIKNSSHWTIEPLCGRGSVKVLSKSNSSMWFGS